MRSWIRRSFVRPPAQTSEPDASPGSGESRPGRTGSERTSSVPGAGPGACGAAAYAEDQHLRFLQAREDLPVQQLIAQLPIEAFDVSILPRTPRLDEQRLHSKILQPVTHHRGRELRAVVAADVLRHAARCHQPLTFPPENGP